MNEHLDAVVRGFLTAITLVAIAGAIGSPDTAGGSVVVAIITMSLLILVSATLPSDK